MPDPKETIQEIFDNAVANHSADADKPDDAPKSWEAILPLMISAPAMKAALRDCLGAMQSLRDQVDQMSGKFDDADGTIQEACDAHDETDQVVRTLLEGIPAQPPLAASSVGANHYKVAWAIDIYANSPEEAAEKALLIQRRAESTANVFEVTEGRNTSTVDLGDHPVFPSLSAP